MRATVRNSILVCTLLVCLMLSSLAQASALSNKELEKLVAPIALYPDSLLGNVLIASTYPDDVIEADMWIAKHEHLNANEISSQTKAKAWDENVKTLLLVPDVLSMMVDDLDWTDSLANAYINQKEALFKAIQSFRSQALKSGALADSEEVKVSKDSYNNIVIASSDPTVIVVPQYNPSEVYSWRPGQVVLTTALVWGTVETLDWMFNSSVWDWHHYDIYVGPSFNYYHYGPHGFEPWDPHHRPPHGPHHPGPHHPYHPEHHPDKHHHSDHHKDMHSAQRHNSSTRENRAHHTEDRKTARNNQKHVDRNATSHHPAVSRETLHSASKATAQRQRKTQVNTKPVSKVGNRTGSHTSHATSHSRSRMHSPANRGGSSHSRSSRGGSRGRRR